jgi:hypothetical protein
VLFNKSSKYTQYLSQDLILPASMALDHDVITMLAPISWRLKKNRPVVAWKNENMEKGL